MCPPSICGGGSCVRVRIQESAHRKANLCVGAVRVVTSLFFTKQCWSVLRISRATQTSLSRSVLTVFQIRVKRSKAGVSERERYRLCGLARMSELLALISDRMMSDTSQSRAEPLDCHQRTATDGIKKREKRQGKQCYVISCVDRPGRGQPHRRARTTCADRVRLSTVWQPCCPHPLRPLVGVRKPPCIISKTRHK